MDSENMVKEAAPVFSDYAQKTIDKFADEMVQRMKNIRASDWKQGWITGGSTGVSAKRERMYGMPQNLQGRNYSGSNSMFLSFDTVTHGYAYPVYMTLAQIEKEGLKVKSGAQSVPVIFWNPKITDVQGKRISSKQYHDLPEFEKKKCKVSSSYKTYHVYNVDQTDMRTKQEEKYDALAHRFMGPQLRDTEGMYTNPAIDSMIFEQSWICRIQAGKIVDGAFYSPSRDLVVCPKKEQFNIGKTPEEVYKNGMEYYSSLFHEMCHSTGTVNRLNRKKGQKFGDHDYAVEELVAELTAAMVGNALGFDQSVLKNNAAYMDGWINAMRQDPKFILNIMTEVSKSSRMILEKIDEQRIQLGQKPILYRGDDEVRSHENDISQATIMNRQQPIALNASFDFLGLKERGPDNYALSAVYDRKDLGVKRIKTSDAIRYNAMNDVIEKDEFLRNVAAKVFAPEIGYLREMNSHPINYNSAVVVKNPDDTYSVRITIDGTSLEPRKVSNRDACSYMLLNPSLKKDILLRDMVSKAYGDELKAFSKIERKQSAGLKL